MCDICISAEEIKQVSPDEMRRIVEKGFDPFTRQLVNQTTIDTWSHGKYGEIYRLPEPRDFTPAYKAAFQNWKKDLVDVEKDPWRFCKKCGDVIDNYKPSMEKVKLSDEEIHSRSLIFELSTEGSICWFCNKKSADPAFGLKLEFKKYATDPTRQSPNPVIERSNALIPRCTSCCSAMNRRGNLFIDKILALFLVSSIVLIIYGLFSSASKNLILLGGGLIIFLFVVGFICDLLEERKLKKEYGLINIDYKKSPDYKNKISAGWFFVKAK
jgi:hypothetical protein